MSDIAVLGFDLALNTGWAVRTETGILDSGVWNLDDARKDKHNGYAFLMLESLVLDLIGYTNVRGFACQMLCYERPHHRGGAATRIGLGLASTVLLNAAARSIPVLDVAASTLKRFATGNGRSGKADMIAAASDFTKRKIGSDDEADAIWVACWGFEAMIGEHRTA